MTTVEVHNLSGPLCTVNIDPTATVADLKLALAKVLGVPRRQQRLLSGMALLTHSQSLAEVVEQAVTFTRIAYSALALEWIPRVRKKSGLLQHAPLEVRNDHEVVLTAMQGDKNAIKWAADELLNDRDFATAVVSWHGQALQHLPSWQGEAQPQGDRVAPDLPCCLNHAPGAYEDRSVVLAAVGQDASAIEFASASLLDQEFLLLATTKSKGQVLRHLSRAHLNRDLQKAAVRCNWLMLGALEEALPGLGDDEEIVLEAVACHGCALEFASERLRSDRHLVELALRRSRGAALRYTHALCGERDLVWIAIEEDAGNLRYASEELRGDAELVLEAVKRNGNVLKYAADPLLEQEAIVQAAVQQAGGHVLQFAHRDLVVAMEAVDIFAE